MDQRGIYQTNTWTSVGFIKQTHHRSLLPPPVPEKEFQASLQDDVMRGVRVVLGAVLERVRVPARGVAQLALVLLQDRAGHQAPGVEEVVVGDDVVVLLLAEAELAPLGVPVPLSPRPRPPSRPRLVRRPPRRLLQLLADEGSNLRHTGWRGYEYMTDVCVTR